MFAVAAVAKIVDRGGARQAVAAFALPRALVRPLAAVLPVTELAVVAALLVTTTAVAGAIAALALLALFMAGVAVSLVQGRRPDCRCFGQVHSAPVSWRTLGRDAALAAVAAWVAVEGPGEGLGAWASGITALEWATLFIAVALAVAFAVEGSLLVDRWRRTRRR